MKFQLSPAALWSDREVAARRKKELTGFAVSCPRCWKPYPVDGARRHPLTGKAACKCPDREMQSIDDFAVRYEVHGLEALIPTVSVVTTWGARVVHARRD